MVRLLITLVVLLSIAMACRGEKYDNPTGPLLAYTTRDWPGSTGEGGDFSAYLVLYDVGRETEHIRTRIAAPDQSARPVLAANGRIVFPANDGDIHVIDAWTGDHTVISSVPNLAQVSLALSPGGTAVAFVETSGDGALSIVRTLELDSGALRTIGEFPRRPGSANEPYLNVRAWGDDGRLLLNGGSLDGGDGWWTSLSLDGQVTRLGPLLARPSPTGRYLVLDGTNQSGCFPRAPQLVQLFDVVSNSVVAEVADPDLSTVAFDWSPDGNAALLRKLRVLEPNTNDCAPTYDLASGDYSLLTAAGVADVPDLAALLRTWHGEHLVEFRCSLDGNAAGPWSPEECRDRGQMILTLNDVVIETNDELHFVGFVERP